MTISGLKSRLARIDKEIARHEKAASQHVSQKLLTNLPPVSDWPSFASRTWIVSGDETGNKIVPFRPYDCQKDLAKRIEENEKIIVLKSRQLGISEEICSILLNRALTEAGFTAVIISKTQKDSSELARRVKFMAKSIKGETLDWTSDSTTRLAWEGRGTLHFLPATGEAGRGIPACSVLFFDEGAFIEGIADIYQGAAPTMAKLGRAGKIIVVSTPDLEANWYGMMWSTNLPSDWYDYVEQRDFTGLQAILDAVGDGWCRVALHYSMHPEYGKNPDWATNYKRELKYTEAQWNAEFELKFGSTASVVYPSAVIRPCINGYFSECGLVNRTYVQGVDPNGGGKDYFTSMVLDITKFPYHVVNLYRDSHRSSMYSEAKVKEQIDNFSPSSILVEQNSMGVVIAEHLQATSIGAPIETLFMSRPTKNIVTDRILYYMENHLLTFPEGIIPEELRAFRNTEKGTREASAGFHDDCVMALALCLAQTVDSVDLTSVLACL